MDFELKTDACPQDRRATPGLSREQQSTPSRDASERHRASPKPLQLQPVHSRKVVLVVDDDLPTLRLLQDILRRENYQLVVAEHPQTALELVGRGLVPDLLITDVHMPEMTGVDLSRKIRAVIPTLPVLFETGHASRLFSKQPELEANTAFITKPFSKHGVIEAARLVMFGTVNPG